MVASTENRTGLGDETRLADFLFFPFRFSKQGVIPSTKPTLSSSNTLQTSTSSETSRDSRLPSSTVRSSSFSLPFSPSPSLSFLLIFASLLQLSLADLSFSFVSPCLVKQTSKINPLESSSSLASLKLERSFSCIPRRSRFERSSLKCRKGMR